MTDILSPQFFGILSFITVAIAIVPYYVDILRGNSKPQRAATGIFLTLTIISFFGQLAEGAKASLLFAGALLLAQAIMFILAIKYGMGGWDKKDKIALLLAVIILIAWYFTKSATVALILTTTVNTIAKVLVTIKVYYHPYTELLFAWYMSVVASIFGTLAVNSNEWILYLVPIHNAVTTGIIALVIFFRRKLVQSPK